MGKVIPTGNSSQNVKLSEMPIAGKEKINDTMKKRLESIVYEEFANQSTRFQYELNKQQREILDDYKKSVNWDQIHRNYNRAILDRTEAVKELDETGLTTDGVINGLHVGDFNKKQRDALEKVLKDYAKKVGHTAIVNKIKKADDMIAECSRKIEESGLTPSGEVAYTHTAKSQRIKDIINSLNTKLTDLEKAVNPLNNMRSKYIARLWMSTTMEEANAIMYEVMGNDQIPPVKRAQVTHQQ